MAPFPTLRRPTPSSPSLLPISTPSSPNPSSSSSYPPQFSAYPPSAALTNSLPPSRITSPSPLFSPSSRSAEERIDFSGGAGEMSKIERYGSVKVLRRERGPENGAGGKALGRGQQATETCRMLLELNHLNHHIHVDDEGNQNHLAHHLLSSYALGASATLLQEIYDLHVARGIKPLPPPQPFTITPQTWTSYLGSSKFYPNYLSFFHTVLSSALTTQGKEGVRRVLEKYLFGGGESEMLVRSVTRGEGTSGEGEGFGLTLVGMGVEWGLEAIIAEGLALTAITPLRDTPSYLFPSGLWPPPPPPSRSFFPSSWSRVLPSVSITGLPLDPVSFQSTIHSQRRVDPRIPDVGLSGLTILERIASTPARDEEEEAQAAKRWTGEWRFEGEVKEGRLDDQQREKRKGWEGVPPEWEEVVEKVEECWWVAGAVVGGSGGERRFIHYLPLIATLPTLLAQVVGIQNRPFVVHSVFRSLIGAWVEAGRPTIDLPSFLSHTSSHPSPPTSTSSSSTNSSRTNNPQSAVGQALSTTYNGGDRSSTPDLVRQYSSSSSTQSTPSASASSSRAESPKTPQVNDNGRLRDEGEGDVGAGGFGELSGGEEELGGKKDEGQKGTGTNPWWKILDNAGDHPDGYVAETIIALAAADELFGHSPMGFFQASLRGSNAVDGTLFVRVAGLLLDRYGWQHAGHIGSSSSPWDPTTYSRVSSPPAPDTKGKGRERSDTITPAEIEVVELGRALSSVGVGVTAPKPVARRGVSSSSGEGDVEAGWGSGGGGGEVPADYFDDRSWQGEKKEDEEEVKRREWERRMEEEERELMA